MLSIVINVKNGEKYLVRCLNALTRFKDVVVLDNYSTDKTLEIAQTYPNVRVFQHEFCGMGKLRNIAANYAKHDWLFFVDCDEIVSQKLVDTLLTLQFKNKHVYSVLRHNFYDNFKVNASSWGNDWILRIYNRNQTQFSNNEVHESVILHGLTEKKIHGGFIYHFPYTSVAELIDKMQFYSTLYAKQHFGKKQVNLYTLPFRTAFMFIQCYILKCGFLYGYEGLIISTFNAIGVFTKYIKLYELSYKRKIAVAVGVVQNMPEIMSLIEKINQQTLLPEQVLVLVDDKLLDTNTLSTIQELLNTHLIVQAKVIGAVNQDIATILGSYMINQPNLQNIAYIRANNLLNNSKLFKQCKNAILAEKTLQSGIEIFNS